MTGTSGATASGSKKSVGGRKDRSSVCSYCNMTFNKKEHLQRHERTHTLDRPYHCDFPTCGKTFARRDTLTRHSRLHKRDEAMAGEPAEPTASSKAIKKRRTRTGSAASVEKASASESEMTGGTGSTSTAPVSDASASSLQEVADGEHEPMRSPSPNEMEPEVTVKKEEEPEIFMPEQPTPSNLTTASLLYGMAWDGRHSPPPSLEHIPGNVTSVTMPATFSFAAEQASPETSSLGLDILPPQNAFQRPDVEHQATVPVHDIPAFLPVSQNGFQFFLAPTTAKHTAHSSQPSQQQFQQRQQREQQPPSALASGEHQHSFLSHSAGSPYASRLFHGPGEVGLSHSGYSPDDSTMSDDESFMYTSSASEAPSLSSSVHSMIVPLPPTFRTETFEEYLYGSAFKRQSAFLPSMPVGQHFFNESKMDHLLAAEPVDDFLQWPSREASPAPNYALGMSPENTLSISSSDSPSAASFLDFSDLDSASSLFADKTITAPQNLVDDLHSSSASLEEWLLRQSYSDMQD